MIELNSLPAISKYLGAVITGFLGFIGWHYKKTVSRIDKVEDKQTSVRVEIAEIHKDVKHIHESIHRIEKDFNTAAKKNGNKLSKILDNLHARRR